MSAPFKTSAAFETAREFAKHGMPVMPVHAVHDGRCLCGKPDCPHPGKHPKTDHAYQDATTDERELLDWNERWPDANWALACGASNVAVVDIDSKAGADPDEVIPEFHLTGPAVLTGEAIDGDLSGVRGAHVYCANGVPSGNAPVNGIEIKAAGTYVLLPGSRHVSGVAYEWAGEQRPWDGPLAPVPEALRPAATRRGCAPAVEEMIPAGQRNTVLTSMAGTVRRRGGSEAEILALLEAINEGRCKPPMPPAELQKIARSVSRYTPAQDVLARVEELTELLGLDKIGRRVDMVRVFGRGSNAVAIVFLDDGGTIRLDPLSRFGTPTRLAQEIALQAGAAPTLKGSDVMRFMVLLHQLADHVATFEAEDRARDHGTDYLRATPVQIVQMDDQGSRWAEFSLLARCDAPGGPPRFVLEDQGTGARYVRAQWFRQFVRDRSGPGEADATDRAVTSLGWSKPGSEGRIKASQPRGRETWNWAFYVVPKGWEDE